MVSRPATIKRLTSSGGVIFRRSENGADVALISVKGGTVWCLPKGIIDRNENSRITAVREVREETGLSGSLIDEIGDISYWYFIKSDNARIHKTVHFYLLSYDKGSTDDHDSEVDDAGWFPIKEAVDKLSYKGEKRILQKAKEIIEGRGTIKAKNSKTGH